MKEKLNLNEVPQLTLITGANGSGKSKKIREYLKYSNAFQIIYTLPDEYILEMYLEDSRNLFQMLWGEDIEYDTANSASQILLKAISFDVAQILDLEPCLLLFDSLPVSLDNKRLINLFTLFRYLVSRGYKVVFATAQLDVAIQYKNFFKEGFQHIRL